jgi:hypothetical protein
MKIYIAKILFPWLDNYVTVGICSTIEKAEECIENKLRKTFTVLPEKHRPMTDIEEWEIDKF